MNKLPRTNRYSFILILTVTVFSFLFAFSGVLNAQDFYGRTREDREDSPERYLCPEVECGGAAADDFSVAECEYKIEDELGLFDLGGNSPSGLSFFIWFFYAAAALAAVLALTMIVLGGVQYVSSAGNAGGQSAAKQRIQNALLGLILVMASSLILYTINPSLTEFKFPSLEPPDLAGIDAAKEYCECIETKTHDECSNNYSDPAGSNDNGSTGPIWDRTGGGETPVGGDCTVGTCADGLKCSSLGKCYLPGSAGVGEPCPGGSTDECEGPYGACDTSSTPYTCIDLGP